MLAFFSLTLLAPLATALHLAVRGTRELQPFVRRGSGALEFRQMKYWTTITLGGRSFEVNVDTGSDDFWVATSTPLSDSRDTGMVTSTTYVGGHVVGRIKTNQLRDFLGFSVDQQAYMEVIPQPGNPFTSEGTGMLGLGPGFISNIYNTLGGSITSVPVINRIFLQNRDIPNIVTYLLGRANDPTGGVGGHMTVSSILPGYGKILDQPEVPAVITKQNNFSNWALLVDAIKAPNGRNINFIPNILSKDADNLKIDPNGKLIAVVDTGFTKSQIPSEIWDAIYGNIDGAREATWGDSSFWAFPCTTELDISITIGGIDRVVDSFPSQFHDEIIATLGSQVLFEGDICQPTFEKIDPRQVPRPVQLILGMNILRNVYMLISYGNFVVGDDVPRGDPYFQLLSTTTDPSLTHQEFVAARGGTGQGGAQGGSVQGDVVQGNGGQGSRVQGAAALGDGKSTRDTKKPLVISWAAIVGIILGVVLILSVLFLSYRWKKKSHRGMARGFPFNIPFVGKSRGKYAQFGSDDDGERLLRTY
ncbi:aspartic peptidase domain-containing protein [Flagelloscypha sp. PMI_526]|nr:aspartic peptidase domain-containing protein [Flagelloscypha sp. PMI_526]